jgi:hypothetical protein
MKRPPKPINRMTLQELLTQSEKCTRELSEHFHAGLFTTLADFHEVSRPTRKKSRFPTVQALKTRWINCLKTQRRLCCSVIFCWNT